MSKSVKSAEDLCLLFKPSQTEAMSHVKYVELHGETFVEQAESRLATAKQAINYVYLQYLPPIRKTDNWSSYYTRATSHAKSKGLDNAGASALARALADIKSNLMTIAAKSHISTPVKLSRLAYEYDANK